MEQENKINELSLKAIPDLYGKNFFIPDYQRGYRWGTRQVEQLMNDLCNFFDERGKGDFYCLQPIVVKELTEGERQHMISILILTITVGMKLLTASSVLRQYA